MFDDIDERLQLAHTTHTTRAAPNFLLALGLSCYTVSNNNEGYIKFIRVITSL
jgi:hypothetical protein